VDNNTNSIASVCFTDFQFVIKISLEYNMEMVINQSINQSIKIKILQKLPIQIGQNHISRDHLDRVPEVLNQVLPRLFRRFVFW